VEGLKDDETHTIPFNMLARSRWNPKRSSIANSLAMTDEDRKMNRRRVTKLNVESEPQAGTGQRPDSNPDSLLSNLPGELIAAFSAPTGKWFQTLTGNAIHSCHQKQVKAPVSPKQPQ